MSNEKISFHLNKNGNLYRLWLAAVNHKEFERIMKLNDFEIILVSRICDEIMDKMTQSANNLALIRSDIESETSIRSPFLEASQLAIGLICVFQQQVKFLYEQVCRYSLQSRFVVEKQKSEQRVHGSISMVTQQLSSKKLPSKRKRSTVGKQQPKTSRTNEHTLPENPFIFDLNEELSDRETENQTTVELLQNSFVMDPSKITIQEDTSESANSINATTEDFMDIDFSEIIANNEPYSVPSLNQEVMEDQQDSTTVLDQLIHDIENVAEDNFPITNDSEQMLELHNVDIISNVPDLLISDEQEPHGLMQSENSIKKVQANDGETVRKVATRKRKRVRPFKDRVLRVDVEHNMETSSRTQSHLKPLDDCTERNVRLNHLCSNFFNNPAHKLMSESIQHLKFSPMSNKLLMAFKRGTLLKKERMEPVIVPPEPSIDALIDTHINSQNAVQDVCSNQNQDLDQSPTEGRLTVWEQHSLDEVIPTQTAPIEPAQIPMIFDIEPTNECQHVEVAPEIHQLLHSCEADSYNRFETNSQKIFVMRSRQNRQDWGTEGVLRKLLSLWNCGVHPIGMEQLMQSTNQRLSAATAFFSIMALNSPRIDLINIEKNPDSNAIYNIVQSPKLLELQQAM